jgi:hypothetical protein
VSRSLKLFASAANVGAIASLRRLTGRDFERPDGADDRWLIAS